MKCPKCSSKVKPFKDVFDAREKKHFCCEFECHNCSTWMKIDESVYEKYYRIYNTTTLVVLIVVLVASVVFAIMKTWIMLLATVSILSFVVAPIYGFALRFRLPLIHCVPIIVEKKHQGWSPLRSEADKTSHMEKMQ